MSLSDGDIQRFLERASGPAPVDVVDARPLNRAECFLLIGLSGFLFGPFITILGAAVATIWYYTQKLPPGDV